MSTTAPGLRPGAIALGLVLSLVAQSDRGSIVGIATDSTGAAIPRVTVVVTNTATNDSRETLSTESGNRCSKNYRRPSTKSPSSSVGASIIGVHIDTTGELK
jgi:hypothetical protein